MRESNNDRLRPQHGAVVLSVRPDDAERVIAHAALRAEVGRQLAGQTRRRLAHDTNRNPSALMELAAGKAVSRRTVRLAAIATGVGMAVEEAAI